MIAALTFTSMRAVSSLNAGLDSLVHRMALRADRTSQIVEGLSDIGGLLRKRSTGSTAFSRNFCR
jgi:hypothetical protein